MVEVGDRVEIRSRSGPRVGVVLSLSGSMLRLRWDNGEETSLVPGPGVLSLVKSSGTSGGKLPKDRKGSDEKTPPTTKTKHDSKTVKAEKKKKTKK